MANYKYLDLVGLTYYDKSIKGWVGDQITALGIDQIRTNASNAVSAWNTFLEGLTSPAPNLKTISDTLTALSNGKLDKNAKAADSDKLNGQSASYYATAESVTELGNAKLGKSEKAADSDKLNGQSADFYATAESVTALGAAKLDKDAKAVDSDKLNGQSADFYATAESVTELGNAKLGKSEKAADSDKLNGQPADFYATATDMQEVKSAISGGTFFRGVFDKLSDVENPKNGDIVVVGDLEYIYDDIEKKDWVELGNSSANATAIAELTANKLGKTEKAVDSDKLNGQSASYYATAQSVTELGNAKLGKSEKAADSDKLNGQSASYYATAQSMTDLRTALLSTEINATGDNYVIATISKAEIDTLFGSAQA